MDGLWRQVKLLFEGENITRTRVCYIEDKYATVGKPLKVQEDNGQWDVGWTVKEVYGEPTDNPPDWRRDVRSHRLGTGDDSKKPKRKGA